jgi:hypothetical protein
MIWAVCARMIAKQSVSSTGVESLDCGLCGQLLGRKRRDSRINCRQRRTNSHRRHQIRVDKVAKNFHGARFSGHGLRKKFLSAHPGKCHPDLLDRRDIILQVAANLASNE